MCELTFQGAIEGLYNLSGDELRTLAWEALLISDGPDKTPENTPTAGSKFEVEPVYNVSVWAGEPWERTGFTITGNDGWETATTTPRDEQ